MRCRVTLFSLSGWRSGLLLRDFFSYLLRHIPEKGNEKDPLLSQGSGSIRSWSAQVAEVSSATCRKKKKRKKKFTEQPSPHPSKVERSRGAWEVGQEKPAPLPHPEAENPEGRASEKWFFLYIYFIFRSNPERRRQAKLESGWVHGDACLKWQRSFSTAAAVPAKPGQWPHSWCASGGVWPRNWPRLLRFISEVWKALSVSSSGCTSGRVQTRSCRVLAGCSYFSP